MSLTQKTDHVETGLGLLITQYKNKSNLSDLITTYLDQVQEIEDVLFDVLAIALSKSTQVGEQLDLLGRIVGQAREGRADAIYWRWIQARLLVNRSSGLPDELQGALDLVVPECTNELEEFWPASIVVRLVGAFSGDAESIASLLTLIRAAGVGANLEYSTADYADTFQFASGDTSEATADAGFSGHELSTNGDLENWTAGSLDDWTTDQTPPNLVLTEVGSEESHGGAGTGAANFYGTVAGDISIKQTVAGLTIGKTYRVQIEVSAFAATGDAYLYIYLSGGVTLLSDPITAVGSYYLDFTAVATTQTIWVYRQGAGTTDATVDHLCMWDIAEGGQWAAAEEI